MQSEANVVVARDLQSILGSRGRLNRMFSVSRNEAAVGPNHF